ncbi:hypothetical protein [Nocardia noduli]|uniref:hypothetical protein n=1 Tax=Nocardia noduli TaxID=2815722 RepID=UPI001C2131FD|nr:hypothetical protein [Nocardia noduli]
MISTAGTIALICAYIYWAADAIDPDEILNSLMLSVLKFFIITIGIIMVIGVTSMFRPTQCAQADRFWLVRRFDGPIIAIGAFVAVFAVMSLNCLLLPVFGLWVAAFVNVFRLGATHQFRLADAHPALPSVCLLIAAVWNEIAAVTQILRDGFNPVFPIWVGLLVAFAGPLATIGCSVFEIRAELRRTGL